MAILILHAPADSQGGINQSINLTVRVLSMTGEATDNF